MDEIVKRVLEEYKGSIWTEDEAIIEALEKAVKYTKEVRI